MRIGLVLGAGGLAGTAFHAGVLAALAEEAGWDARDAEVVVGTSAGSTTAALLRAGLSPVDLFARVSGRAMSAEGRRLLDGVAPPAPAARRLPRGLPRPASAGLLRSALLRPGSVHPGALLAAALPLGATPNAEIAAAIAPLHDRWPERALWISAVRLDTGARVVFGRDDDAPPATVGEAVTASCAIPGYYEPPLIGGVRFVDGGVRSLCAADVTAGLGLDLVVVSAPMATTAWAERSREGGWRSAARAQLELEVRRVRGRGTPVLVLAPGAEARRVMSGAVMDARRRPEIARVARDGALAGLSGEAGALLDRLRAG